MKTGISAQRLAEPRVKAANDILRACVHCGFCAPACPTYQLTGDERDSPRGRIWLIRDLLESDGEPAAEAVTHLDRCLECVACMPACPSGVQYGHLISFAREEIETRARRPVPHRILRSVLARVLTDGARARRMIALARRLRVLAPLLPRRFAAPLRLAGRMAPARNAGPVPGVHRAAGPRKGRVGVLAGCVQAALAPAVNEALVRLLTRFGYEVAVLAAPCCGALDRHLGRGAGARDKARAVVAAIAAERAGAGLDAVVQTASGCGTMMKDYAAVLGDEPDVAADAAAAAKLTKDASEFLGSIEFAPRADVPALTVAWFAPCSAANAQGVHEQPPAILARAGFRVSVPDDGGRCCGSAGVYNMTEPEMAGELGALKAAALGALGADVIASGNIGCMAQMTGRGLPPVLHIVELLDWAAGGPRPAALSGASGGPKASRDR